MNSPQKGRQFCKERNSGRRISPADSTDSTAESIVGRPRITTAPNLDSGPGGRVMERATLGGQCSKLSSVVEWSVNWAVSWPDRPVMVTSQDRTAVGRRLPASLPGPSWRTRVTAFARGTSTSPATVTIAPT